jgi:hypothetical protein
MLSVPFSFIVFVLLIASFVSGSVAIHRSIILNESSWLAALRFRRREWRFLGIGTLIALAVIVPLFVFLAIVLFSVLPMAAPLIKDPAALDAAYVAAYVGAVLILWGLAARLMLALPAVAIDEEGRQLGRAWTRSRGNGLRLWLGSLACWFPFVSLLFVGGAYAIWEAAQVLVVPVGWLFGLFSLLWFLANIFSAVTLVAFYSFAFSVLAGVSVVAPGSPWQAEGMPAQ